MNGSLEEEMGSMIVCDTVCLGVGASPVMGLSSGWLRLPWRGFTAIAFLLENVLSGIEGAYKETFSFHLLFFKCLKLKIINIPKGHI